MLRTTECVERAGKIPDMALSQMNAGKSESLLRSRDLGYDLVGVVCAIYEAEVDQINVQAELIYFDGVSVSFGALCAHD